MKTYPAGMPWLIVRLKGQPFALPILDVRELVMKLQITECRIYRNLFGESSTFADA